MMYAIAWRHKSVSVAEYVAANINNIQSGKYGTGQPIFKTREECHAACVTMNQEYTELTHWPVWCN